MKKEIKKVHDYFTNKIVAGNYQIVDIKKSTVHVIIDNRLFMLDVLPYWNRVGTVGSFMQLEFTKSEAMQLINHLQSVIKDKEQEDLKRQIKKLTDKLN